MRWSQWHPVIRAYLTFTACLGGLIFALWLYVQYDGSVVVRDDMGSAETIVFKSGDFERALWRLPGGTFVGIPDFDATIEARCHNGTIAQGDYVSRHLGLSARVVSDAPCRLETRRSG